MSLENIKVDYQTDDSFVLRENHSPAEALLLNEIGHKNMLHLIHLRWIAVAGQVVTITFAAQWFGVRLPVLEMFAVVFLLFIFNTACHARWHEEKVASNQALFWSLLCDVFSLSALFYFSGGTSNPFVFLFLLQIILAAILLNSRTAWLMMVIASVCVLVLSVYYQPLLLTEGGHFLFDDLYFKGLLSCFVLVAALLVFFITRISNNLRAGEAYLALLRQRAAEEDHLVRMGLLASGAAHELGTPLSTMSVILNDWKRMQCFQQDASLCDELDEVQSQVLRCKRIVSGILLSAGEARGESSRRTTLRHFVDSLVEEWKSSRIVHVFEYCYQIENDFDVVSDSMLKQTICNLLDNALEASPDWLSFRVYLSQGVLNMVVLDQGLGFPESILSNFARPYNSTKGADGRGLGLFLVVNVARKLGGMVKPYNRTQGGGGVHLSIPSSAIMLPAGE